MQKTSTYAVSYLLGSVSPKPTPVTVKHPSGVSFIYTDFWTPSEFSVIDRVKKKFVLNDKATNWSVIATSKKLKGVRCGVGVNVENPVNKQTPEGQPACM